MCGRGEQPRPGQAALAYPVTQLAWRVVGERVHRAHADKRFRPLSDGVGEEAVVEAVHRRRLDEHRLGHARRIHHRGEGRAVEFDTARPVRLPAADRLMRVPPG